MKLKTLELLSILLLISSFKANYTFNVLDSYPQCDNSLKIGVCRNYIIYGLTDAASMFLCINKMIKGGDILSVQNQINLAQNKVYLTR